MLAGAAQADCYADYKAKQDGPLRLHYGIITVSGPCTVSNATSIAQSRLAGAGWQLLNVLSVFDETSLAGREVDEGRPNLGN
jgi:hypothetical protein